MPDRKKNFLNELQSLLKKYGAEMIAYQEDYDDVSIEVELKAIYDSKENVVHKYENFEIRWIDENKFKLK